MAATVPAPMMPDLRAYLVLDTLPAGTRTFHVTDDMAEPHIHMSEVAVVDTTDRELRRGEIYMASGKHQQQTQSSSKPDGSRAPRPMAPLIPSR